jgi:hypothetical protein
VSYATAQASAWDESAPVCQILDRSPDPDYTLSLTYVEEGRFRRYGTSRILLLDGEMDLGYYHDIYCGDIDVAFDFSALLFSSSAEIQLPDQLVILAVDAGWTWRYINDMALQVRMQPGIYSDIEEFAFRTLSLPVSVAGVMPLNPELSATAGFQIRPWFDRLLMPILGVVWQPENWIRVEATLPEARVLYYYDAEWSGFLKWAWESTTYAIKEKGDFDRKHLTLESRTTSAGVTYTRPDGLGITGEFGMIMDRKAIFGRRDSSGIPANIPIEDEIFLRVGVGGPF